METVAFTIITISCISTEGKERINNNFDNDNDKNSAEFPLKHQRLNHPGKIIVSHLIINPIRNKFDLLKEMVTKERDIC